MAKNIALLTTSYLPIQGGVQYLLYWLLKEIDINFERYQKKFGFDNFYLITPKYKNSDFDKFANIKVVYISQPDGKLNTIRNAYLVNKIIKKNRISLIHAHHALTDGILVFLATLFVDTKYVITSHGVDFAYNRSLNYGERLSWLKGVLIRIVSSRANTITTVSNDMVDFVSEIVPLNKIIKIENCYEANGERYDRQIINKVVEGLKEKYSIGNKDTVCLTLSGARKVKGHWNMLIAFANAVKDCPNLKLFIAAHGQETEKLKSKVCELGLEHNVFFIGFVTGLQKQSFFELSDVYINTAFFEPFGLVYLEAIQNDMAVLGSIYGGGKDIFKHLYSAYLSNPYKVSTIKEGLVYLSKKEHRVKLLKNAHPLLEKYSVDKILTKYFKLYQEVLK